MPGLFHHWLLAATGEGQAAQFPTLVIAVVVAYLFASVPFGYLFVRWLKGTDVRDVGSGNIGATNVWRMAGPQVAFPVFALDTLKGCVGVWLGHALHQPLSEPLGAIVGGVVAIVGHNWCVFLGFKGGRGVSTTLGVVIALSPVAAVLAFVVWVVVALATGYISVASLLGGASAPMLMAAFGAPVEYVGVAMIAAVLILIRHIPNLRRLARNQERNIWRRTPHQPPSSSTAQAEPPPGDEQ